MMQQAVEHGGRQRLTVGEGASPLLEREVLVSTIEPRS